jgi:hypothetical protein
MVSRTTNQFFVIYLPVCLKYLQYVSIFTGRTLISRRYNMNRLLLGIAATSLLAGSAFADMGQGSPAVEQAGSNMKFLEAAQAGKPYMILLQTESGQKIKAIVPKDEVTKLKDCKAGDRVTLFTADQMTQADADEQLK